MKPILKRRLQEMLKSPLNNTVIKSIIGCMILLQFISIDATAQKTYTRITSTADLVAGAKYIIVSSQTVGTGRALGYQAANNRPQATITIATGVTVTTTPATLNSQTTAAFEITLGGSTGAWTLYDAVNGGYLRATSSTSNNLQTNAATASWTISFATNAAVMTCTTGSFTRNILRYNSASSLFSCYSTGQAAVYLYKEVIVSNPTIALADNNSQVAAANVNHGTSAHILNKIQLGVTTANAILTGLTATTTGTYQASDITNLKVRYSADATLDGADATLSTLSSVATAGSQTFPTFTSQTINSGSTGYIFITADIAATAIHDRTIGVDAIGSSNLTITGTETYTPTPTTTAGGAQTIKDITAPTASTFSPADNATNISTTSNLVITFNENVQAGTGGNWVIYGPGDVVFETISYNSISFATNTATLNPTGTLLDGTAYYVLVDATAVTDVAGNAYPGISSTTAWNFTTTAAAPVIALADNGSQISIANVNHGTTAHVLNKIQLGVSTSNAILTGLNITTTGSYQTSDITNLKVRYSADATLDALDATLSTITSIGTAGAKTFTPFTSQTINSGTTGYIFITADIAATAIHDRTIGVNAIGSSNLTITGATYSPAPTTTAGGAQTIKDITAPTASTFSPTDDATNISTTSNLVITFNENVQAGTSGNWVIYGPGDVVFESIPYNDASISFSTNTVTLNPTGILATETVYYVLIDATAIADVAGNAYAGVSNTTVWNFTTTPPAPTNDLCDAPIPITLNATAISGTMVNATFTTPFTSSPDVWYSFQTTCSGTHTITVTGFTGDIDLGLFGTSCPSTITTLFSATTLTSTETITANLTIGTTYYLRVLAFNVAAQSSTFTVKVDETNCPISIPVATAATPIAYNSFTANWNTVSGAGGYRLDVSTATFPTATDLFISKYVEGSSNNKYIEIFNGTGAAVNLANYVLRLYSNGSASVSQSLTLSGTLNDGEVKIYRHPSANIYSGTTVADPGSTINFNGDDAIALFNNSTSAFADIFGRIGTDPGTSWTSGSFTTVDKTLIRKRTVSGGVTTNPATFATLATEWDQYNVDVVTLLGSHYIATPTPVVGYDDLSVATNSQSVTDISAETNYYYRVRAINGTATTACSNIISLLTLKDPSFADYESAQDGLSTDLSTWNYNSTGSVYAPAIQVPSSGNNILIRSVDSVILAANLTIGSGKTVTVNGAAQLNDYILDGVGAFTLADGAHLLIGSADGISNSGSTGNIQTTTRSFNAGARYSYIGSTNQVTGNGLPNTVTGLTVKKDASNQTLTLSNPVAVQHYLKLEKGTLDLGANDITLLSNTINTAQVLSIANDADIAINYNGTGRFIHQRYFPAPSRRSWRLLTVPLSNTNSVFDSWQNSGTYEAGKGMFITGPGATGVAGNGIDLSSTNGTSLRLWNNNQSYYNLSNTKTSNVSQGTGSSAANTAYFAFVRGDRTPAVNDFGSVASTVTTLSAKGQLQYGDQTFTNIAANSGQFTMIGNPYASPIDWNLVLGNSGTNIQRKIYTWDARLNTVGGYVALDDVLTPGTFTATPGGSTQTQMLQSGQAFFVITKSTGIPQVQFKETNKSTTNNMGMFRPTGLSGVLGMLRADVYLPDAVSGTRSLADGSVTWFRDDFCKCVDEIDNIKLTNVNETFGTIRNNSFLATEFRSPVLPSTLDTVYFRLQRTTERAYQMEVIMNNIDVDVLARLEDSYTGISTTLTNGTNTIPFVINADVASKNQDRFRVVFGPIGGPLPVTFTQVKASAKNNDIQVEWKVDNQVNIASYEVEKSIDGRNFTKVNTTTASGVNGSAANYNWLDVQAVQGDNFYRIKSIGTTGAIQYSKVVKVTKGLIKSGIAIYPNPVTDGVVGLQLNNLSKGLYTVVITNAVGQRILTKAIQHDGGSATETLQTSSTLAKGMYQLTLIAQDKTQQVTSLLIK